MIKNVFPQKYLDLVKAIHLLNLNKYEKSIPTNDGIHTGVSMQDIKLVFLGYILTYNKINLCV